MGGCPILSGVRRATTGMSLYKPVFLTIVCLNVVALGGLLYSAPWRPKTEQASARSRHQIEGRLLIPVEAKITTDGKVSTRYQQQFLSSASAAIRRKLIDSLAKSSRDSTSQIVEESSESSEPSHPGVRSPTIKAPQDHSAE